MPLKSGAPTAHNVAVQMQTEPGARQCRHAGRRFRACAALILIAAFTLSMNGSLVAAGSRKSHTKQPTAAQGRYASALATADRFLHAWQTGDLETGMVLLSDRARHAQNPETFEQFFSPEDLRAFEITRGTTMRGGYRFPVVLVSARGSKVHRRFSEIAIVATGKSDWTVDKLP